MTAPALAFEDVGRRFGRTVALDRVTLSVVRGQILGIVGRNGAGKTTLLRLAHGYLFPDSGSIRTLGLDPVTQGLEVRSRASLLSEESALYPWMTVEEILAFAGKVHPRWDRELAEQVRTRLDLPRAARIAGLSRGTKAKVALALAVASRPELLLLDDPTAGLDPLVRREVLEEILDVTAAEGGAVVYASHLVHDVERVADRVAVLDGGRVRLEGPLEEIKARVRRARAYFEGDAPREAEIPGAVDRSVEGRVLSVVSEAPDGQLERSLRALGAREVEIESLPLEEILVALLRERGITKEADRV